MNAGSGQRHGLYVLNAALLITLSLWLPVPATFSSCECRASRSLAPTARAFPSFTDPISPSTPEPLVLRPDHLPLFALACPRSVGLLTGLTFSSNRPGGLQAITDSSAPSAVSVHGPLSSETRIPHFTDDFPEIQAIRRASPDSEPPQLLSWALRSSALTTTHKHCMPLSGANPSSTEGCPSSSAQGLSSGNFFLSLSGVINYFSLSNSQGGPYSNMRISCFLTYRALLTFPTCSKDVPIQINSINICNRLAIDMPLILA